MIPLAFRSASRRSTVAATECCEEMRTMPRSVSALLMCRTSLDLPDGECTERGAGVRRSGAGQEGQGIWNSTREAGRIIHSFQFMADGISPSDDPLLLFRAAAYPLSFAKRLTGH